MEDLWPSDLTADASKVKTPAAILKEQGSLLGQKTSNMIIGEARKVVTAERDVFTYDFVLVCSALKYSYSVFFVTHRITLYPVSLWMNDDELLKELGLTSADMLKAEDEDDFKESLRRVFNTKKVKKVITAILSQI